MSRNQNVNGTHSGFVELVKRANKRLLLLSIVCMVGSTIGCNRETKLPTHKVTGKVTKKGVGLPNATVIFHAKNPPAGFIKPRAISDANGEFTLTTYESGDGAPIGDYEVTLEQWLYNNPEVGATNRLPSKFGSPATSGIQVKVAANVNALSPFEVR